MGFNQPTSSQQNAILKVSVQTPQIYFFLGNKLYLQAIEPQILSPVPQLCPQENKTGWETASEILSGIALGVLIGVLIILTAVVIFEQIRPRRNSVPLTAGMRRFIRERDSEICFYCGIHAPNGHVDHRISRANNGSNAPENLTWACVSCNCSKGAMNDTEYIMLLESYC
ncbi:MAG: HNH endonuclease signature motif containing protein [Pyrinomonadaceae bacterium]